ncbi:hypothetical protein ACRAWF_31870 [Streptomyces sp. L7]
MNSGPPSALLAQPSPPGWRDSEAPARVARLEELLGDPAAPGNPVGYRALLQADRRAALSADAEGLLDDFGMNREFVPKELGGSFDSAETLLRVMRPVFRRDVALGTGYGMTTFMAASDVWMGGSAGQRTWMADLLLGGSKAAIAQHETAHTNDFVRSQVRAETRRGTLSITGGKPVVNNLHRADALVLFCRTEPGPGTTGCHSALLLDPHTLPAGRYRVTRRPAALGLRGCFFAGVELDGCVVPRDTLLGPLGSGAVTALRSFPGQPHPDGVPGLRRSGHRAAHRRPGGPHPGARPGRPRPGRPPAHGGHPRRSLRQPAAVRLPRGRGDQGAAPAAGRDQRVLLGGQTAAAARAQRHHVRPGDRARLADLHP